MVIVVNVLIFWVLFTFNISEGLFTAFFHNMHCKKRYINNGDLTWLFDFRGSSCECHMEEKDLCGHSLGLYQAWLGSTTVKHLPFFLNAWLVVYILGMCISITEAGVIRISMHNQWYDTLKGVIGCKIHFTRCLHINGVGKCVYTFIL